MDISQSHDEGYGTKFWITWQDRELNFNSVADNGLIYVRIRKACIGIEDLEK